MAHNTTYLMHHGVKGQRWGVRRTPEQLGYRQSAGYSSKSKGSSSSKKQSSMRAKLSDPAFQKKVKTGAKIAITCAALYGAHKVINDPRALEAGKKLMSAALAKSGGMKSAVLNSAEFKMLSAAKEPAKKLLSTIKSDDFAKTVTGVGAMAGTTSILRSQIKDFKNKPEGDAFDRAVSRTQQISSIGENVNKLAQGPKGQSGNNSNSKSSGDVQIGKHVTDRIGPPSNKGIDKQSKEYQALFKDRSQGERSAIKSLAKAGFDIDQIRKYLEHSAIIHIPKGAYLMHYAYY